MKEKKQTNRCECRLTIIIWKSELPSQISRNGLNTYADSVYQHWMQELLEPVRKGRPEKMSAYSSVYNLLLQTNPLVYVLPFLTVSTNSCRLQSASKTKRKQNPRGTERSQRKPTQEKKGGSSVWRFQSPSEPIFTCHSSRVCLCPCNMCLSLVSKAYFIQHCCLTWKTEWRRWWRKNCSVA